MLWSAVKGVKADIPKAFSAGVPWKKMTSVLRLLCRSFLDMPITTQIYAKWKIEHKLATISKELQITIKLAVGTHNNSHIFISNLPIIHIVHAQRLFLRIQACKWRSWTQSILVGRAVPFMFGIFLGYGCPLHPHLHMVNNILPFSCIWIPVRHTPYLLHCTLWRSWTGCNWFLHDCVLKEIVK